MSPPAPVSSKRRRSASVTSGPGRPNMRRCPTRGSSWAAAIEQILPARPGKVVEAGSPRALDRADCGPALDGAPDLVAAAEQVDGQLARLELVGRRAPPEVARRLAARLGDQRQVGGERPE